MVPPWEKRAELVIKKNNGKNLIKVVLAFMDVWQLLIITSATSFFQQGSAG
jgi:hypothetical protein|tara:strand:- start:72 stop:224 length:153 start_codon:yes stop_codon:yes gene_type:complete